MRVVASNIQLSSAHLLEEQRAVRERLEIRQPRPEPSRQKPVPEPTARREPQAVDQRDLEVDNFIRLIKRYLEQLRNAIRDGRAGETDSAPKPADGSAPAAPAPVVPGSDGPGFRIQYVRQERSVTFEATGFHASGTVKTADGRTIEFDQSLFLARLKAHFERLSITAEVKAAGQLPTPEPATSDAPSAPAGEAPAESAPPADPFKVLGLAGGVLGFDANGDGSIDAQSEVVGRSGDGFAELAQYDQDGNGFIDEGDEIFSKLRIVNRSDDGLASTSLGDKGVGALYLGNVSTPFTVESGNGSSAKLVSSGIYLNEDGTTGTVHQIELLA